MKYKRLSNTNNDNLEDQEENQDREEKYDQEENGDQKNSYENNLIKKQFLIKNSKSKYFLKYNLFSQNPEIKKNISGNNFFWGGN